MQRTTGRELVLRDDRLDSDTRELLEAQLRALRGRLRSKHSKRGYKEDWHLWTAWIAQRGLAVSEVRPVDVQRYVTEGARRGLATNTLRRRLAVMSAFYACFVRAGAMDANPTREIAVPVQERKPHTPWMTADVLKRLLAFEPHGWLEERDALIVLTFFGLGLRRAEIARIAFADCLEVRGDLYLRVIVKGGKEGRVPVPGFLATAWKAWQEKHRLGGALFTRKPSGTSPVAGETVRNAVKRVCQRVGLEARDVTAHAFRRSFITLADEHGVAPRDVQLAVLHAKQGTTEGYMKSQRTAGRAPAEAFADGILPPWRR